ncbi:MAG: hypothetical protein DRJ67_05405 [Thermoprotei archaeon]|nr:MAG: hypothetical protein DRJ67_05405 [Thermoprotei archaeon]
MSIENYLMPGEEIQYKASNVEIGGSTYDLYVTNKRVVLFKARGLIFKRADLLAYRMSDIQNVTYREEGLVFKKGVLGIELAKARVEVKGKPDAIRGAYQVIMQFWGA